MSDMNTSPNKALERDAKKKMRFFAPLSFPLGVERDGYRTSIDSRKTY